MIYEKIKLKEILNISTDAILEIYIPITKDSFPQEIKHLVLIVPGGAYAFVSNREKDPVAISFMKRGFAAACLTYTVGKTGESTPLYPKPHLELMASIDYIRKHAEEYRIDPDKITLVGFSAGGHLVASYGYLYKDKELLDTLKVSVENVRPNLNILSYPVITTRISTHGMSKEIITANRKDLVDLLCVEEHIDKTYPASFIWNTLDDSAVPAINAILFANALSKAGVECELVQFPKGDHGLSMIDENTVFDLKEIETKKDCVCWFDKAVGFIKKHFN